MREKDKEKKERMSKEGETKKGEGERKKMIERACEGKREWREGE